MDSSELIFDSAFDAVRFALTYSSQQYGETLMCKRFGGTLGSGKGLTGLDGAGQAGMIRRALWELDDLYLAVLVARCAPRDMPCTCGALCCSKHRPNPEWQAAITWLTDQSTGHVGTGYSHRQVRRAIIERIFGSREDLKDIGQRCDVHRNTVGNHYAALRLWLEGRRGRKGEQAQAGVIDMAWAEIETKLMPLTHGSAATSSTPSSPMTPTHEGDTP